MGEKKTRIIAAVLMAALVLALLSSAIYAKYIRSVSMNLQVTFSAGLAEGFRLTEHEAVKNTDGSYTLNQNEVTENSYTVMPGVDIPKDPQIIIKNKSAVGAYLYIEVIGECPEGVSYSLTENWIALSGVTGKNGGRVYVYSSDGSGPAVLDESFDQQSVSVIRNNMVYVSDHARGPEDFFLKFHGYMAQITESGSTAADVFNTSFGGSDKG